MENNQPQQLPESQIKMGAQCLKMYVDTVIRDEMIKWISKDDKDKKVEELGQAVNQRILKEMKEVGDVQWKKIIESIKTTI